MAGRRGWGEDSIYFDHSGECRDPDNHRHCPGRWRGVVSLKSGPDGKRRRKKVSGRNKTEVRAKLAELHDELNDGVVSEAGYTVAQAIRDYLADGLPGRAPKTIRTQREVLEPLLPILGNVPLRELTAADVRSALIKLATTRATRTVSMTHAALARAIRHAEAGDKVRRNVAALVDSPSGCQGRPSRSLTFEQAVALITVAREYALYAYVVLSLLVGLRTEEARALRWDHVHLDADSGLPPHVDVWRSVRAYGDVKTSRSRRSLALPVMAVQRSQNIRSVRPGLACGQVNSGRNKSSCSPLRSGRASMQATSADRSVRCAGKLESVRTGPLESCATRSCRCCPATG
jgi:integrase